MKSLSIANGDLVIEDQNLALVDDDEATRQRVAQRLRLFRGEWFLDQRRGVPWFREALGQTAPRDEVIRSIVRAAILRDPEVASIPVFELDFEGRPRRVSIRVRIRLANGSELPIEETLP